MRPDLPRLVIAGTGFGAFNLLKRLDGRHDITVVSPRNHFLFTPLLPSTTVGTIEFRSIIEPIRRARSSLRFYHALAVDLDPERRILRCRGAAGGDEFDAPYDILVLAVGAVSNTFGVPGVADHALFLKELHDAHAVRQRIILCFERANLPSVSPDERRRLLHFVVCGGGPTGVEFAAELHDFLMEDLRTAYPHLVGEAMITVVEAMKEILGGFDEKLRRYAVSVFRRQRIRILTESPVTRVEAGLLTLSDGTQVTFGLLLWSTGNGPTEFAQRVPLPKDARQRFVTDTFFRVQGHASIYAIGDCAVSAGTPLPATAQVAQQQGDYVARSLNRLAAGREAEPFSYKHMGMLAYIGGNRALADLDAYKGRGWATWLLWRSAYLTKIIGLKNKVLVLFDWFRTRVFGRDVSHF